MSLGELFEHVTETLTDAALLEMTSNGLVVHAPTPDYDTPSPSKHNDEKPDPTECLGCGFLLINCKCPEEEIPFEPPKPVAEIKLGNRNTLGHNQFAPAMKGNVQTQQTQAPSALMGKSAGSPNGIAGGPSGGAAGGPG